MRVSASITSLHSRLAAARRGNVAMIVAVVVPAIGVCAAGATELAFLLADRNKLQDAADAAALAGANQLAFGSEASVLERAKAHAVALTEAVATRATVNVITETVSENNKAVGVRVNISSNRTSFFGNMLPPGGFNTEVTASALGMGKANLCVFGTSEAIANSVNVANGTVLAGDCVVHSNYNVNVGLGSMVTAAAVRASGTVDGSAANTENGAAKIPDPFTTLKTAPTDWNNCKTNKLKGSKENEVLTVEPGVHCGNIDMDKNSKILLKPGVHYFRDKLQLKDRSSIESAPGGATMVLGPAFELVVDNAEGVRWSLSGLNAAGAEMSGFALVVDRARSPTTSGGTGGGTVAIPAKIITRLEGVVYAPSTPFVITGASQADGAGAASNWTVLVGRDIRVENGATVDINADYAASPVPVPSGVGNKSTIGQGSNRLRQ